MATLFASEVAADILLKSEISDNRTKALQEHSTHDFDFSKVSLDLGRSRL